MRFGICAGPHDFGAARTAGFDYLEPGLAWHLAPLADDADTLPAIERALAAAELPVEALNGMLPAELKIVGPAVDAGEVDHYLKHGARRAAWIGAATVVFGSGGSRRVPEGFSRALAEDQIADFLVRAGDEFGAQGITLAIEPLNTAECNILNSVAEASAMAARVAHPSVQVLSDLYHVGQEGQSYSETADAGAALAHVHVARPGDRWAPQEGDLEMMTAYFGALRRAGYDRRVSIEGVWLETQDQAAEGLRVLRTAWERSGAGASGR